MPLWRKNEFPAAQPPHGKQTTCSHPWTTTASETVYKDEARTVVDYRQMVELCGKCQLPLRFWQD